MSSKEVSTTSNNSNVSDDVWIVPVVGQLSTTEYRKLRRLLHDLGRRNIYMRFKYVARLYHSGLLEQLVDFLNETGGKRKRSEDEEENEELPEAKRKAGDDAQIPKSNDNNEEDAALTDYDSDDGDSSDEDEEDEEDEEGEEEEGDGDGDGDGEDEGKEKDGIKFTEGLFRSLCRARRHVSTQTDGQSDSH